MSQFPSSGYAACGLTACPIEKYQRHDRDDHRALFDLGMTFGETNHDGEPADYWMTQFRAEGVFTPWFRGAVVVPFGQVDMAGERKTGLSDVTLDAVVLPLRWNQERSKWLVGSQFEFPTGDEAAGLSSGHYEAVPYTALHFMHRSLMSYVQVGGRLALNSGDEMAGGMHSHGSIVDPHADQEMLFRVGAVHHTFGWLSPGLAVVGQTVLAQEDRGTTYLSLVPELNFALHEHFWTGLKGEIPVTPDKRFDWRAGITLSYLF